MKNENAEQPAQQQSCYCLNCESLSKQVTALKTCLEVERGFHAQEQSAQQEPFGYFKAEPFGWTDCAETDEGAVALYTTPQPPQQEPVAWAMYEKGRLLSFWMERGDAYDFEFTSEHSWVPLYTAPQPAQRKPLTINEVEHILAQHNYEIHGDRARYIVRMTEAAHGIKEKS